MVLVAACVETNFMYCAMRRSLMICLCFLLSFLILFFPAAAAVSSSSSFSLSATRDEGAKAHQSHGQAHAPGLLTLNTLFLLAPLSCFSFLFLSPFACAIFFFFLHFFLSFCSTLRQSLTHNTTHHALCFCVCVWLSGRA